MKRSALVSVCACCEAIAQRRQLASTASLARFSVDGDRRQPRRRPVQRHAPRNVVPQTHGMPPQPTHDRERTVIDPSSLPWNQYNETGPDARASTSVLPFEETSTPVIVPDDPQGLVQADSPAAKLLAQPALIVVRQLEMLNLFIGFEQASRFAIMSPSGEQLGYLLEENLGFGSMIGRQMLRTHRGFKCVVMDLQGDILLRFQRPVSLINSRISVTAGSAEQADASVVGEARQVWAPLRRKYELFIKAREGDDENAFQQFASIDAPFLAWDFDCLDSDSKVCASISRRWAGWGRELFTDTGQYVLRFDAVVDDTATKLLTSGSTDTSRSTNSQHVANADKAASASQEDREKSLVLAQQRTTQGLTLDERAILLACAVSLDVDYFSRSRGGPGADMMLLPFYGGWGSGSEAAETGEATGIQGGDVEGQQDPSGSMGRSPYPGDEDAPMPEAPPPSDSLPDDYQEEFGNEQPMQDPWGTSQDPWDKGGSGSWWGGGSGGGNDAGGGDWGGGDW